MTGLKLRINGLYDDVDTAIGINIPRVFTSKVVQNIRDGHLFVDDLDPEGVYQLKPSVCDYLKTYNFNKKTYLKVPGNAFVVNEEYELTADDRGILEALMPDWYAQNGGHDGHNHVRLILQLAILAILAENETRRLKYKCPSGGDNESCFTFTSSFAGRQSYPFVITLANNMIIHGVK